jgi:gluconolactonase
MQSSIEIYDNRVLDILNSEFQLLVLCDDCQFTEGPLWNDDGFYLFSDIPANSIYSIHPGEEKKVFLEKSGTGDPMHADLNPEQAGSNGLAYDINGDLLVCRHGSHSVARYTNTLDDIVNCYDGKPLNSPNDLAVHRNGTVFFSDPPYGLKEGKSNESKYQSSSRVYALKDKELNVVCEKYEYPNGVILSKDEKHLFICSNKPFEAFISVYDANTFDFVQVFAKENSDGMEIDDAGNLYLCNREGLIVLNSDGKRAALIRLPNIPSNCCWGGNLKRDLLVTARNYVLLLKDFKRS